jgi:thioredoxin 1
MAGKLFLVACLCAQWCTSCRAYKAVFDAAASAHPDVAFRWVDIEDEAALLDDIEVNNFPTILIGDHRPRFFGTIPPQPEVLTRLISAHRKSASPAAFGEEVVTLLSRLRAD